MMVHDWLDPVRDKSTPYGTWPSAEVYTTGRAVSKFIDAKSFYRIVWGVFIGSVANFAPLSSDLQTFHTPLASFRHITASGKSSDFLDKP